MYLLWVGRALLQERVSIESGHLECGGRCSSDGFVFAELCAR